MSNFPFFHLTHSLLWRRKKINSFLPCLFSSTLILFWHKSIFKHFHFAHTQLMNRFASVDFPNICTQTEWRLRRKHPLDRNFQLNSSITSCILSYSGNRHTPKSTAQVWRAEERRRTTEHKPKINNSSKFTNICWPIKFSRMDAMMRNEKIAWKRKFKIRQSLGSGIPTTVRHMLCMFERRLKLCRRTVEIVMPK